MGDLLIPAHHGTLQGGAAPTAWYDLVSGCVSAWSGKGAATAAASYVNLKNPGTYNLSVLHAPAWDTGVGWTFDTTDDCFDTGIVPPNDASLTFLTRIANGQASGDRCYFGVIHNNSGTYNGIAIQTFAGNHDVYNDGFRRIGAEYTTGSVVGVSGRQAYKAGLADGAAFADIAGAMPAYSIYLGALNLDGAHYQSCGNTIVCAGCWTPALSAADVKIVSDAMDAL